MQVNRKKLLLALLTGAITLQIATCQTVTAIASSITAGGVMYLVRRVMD